MDSQEINPPQSQEIIPPESEEIISPQKAKIIELVLTSTMLGCKFKKITYYTFRNWYMNLNRPSPIFELIFCISIIGFVPLYMNMVTSCISYGVPTGKYVRFFTMVGIVLYVISQVYLFEDLLRFTEVLELIAFLALLIVLLLEWFNVI